MANGSMVVSESGKLTSQNDEIKKLTRSFMKANNKIAEYVEEQNIHEKTLKELNEKKKALTAKVNEEIKEIKQNQKQLRDKVIFQLGERSAQAKILKELGASVEDKETLKRIPQNLKVEIEHE